MRFFREIFFRLSVGHGYYEDGLCKDLSFVPTRRCRELMRAHRISLKPVADGFLMVIEKREEAGVLEPVVPLDVDTGFSFFVLSARADLLNLTDLDLASLQDGKKFFFRNLPATPAVPNGFITTYTIHNNTPVTESLLAAPLQFLAPVNMALDPFKLVLLDGNGVAVAEKAVPRNIASEIVAEKLLLSDTPFEEGIYRLRQADAAGTELAHTDYFLSSETVPPGTVGIIQLNYNTALAASPSTEFHFRINLASRRITWIYRVEVASGEDASMDRNPADIRLNDHVGDAPNTIGILGTAFTKTPLPGPFASGTLAVIEFESSNRIQIREAPYKGVMLLEDNGGPPKKLVKNLPNPDPFWLGNAGPPGQFQSQVAIKIR